MTNASTKSLKNTPIFIPEFFSRIEETGSGLYLIEAEYQPSQPKCIQAEKELGENHILLLDYPEWNKDEEGWSTLEDFYSLAEDVQKAWVDLIVEKEYSIYSLGCLGGVWLLERWDSSTDKLFLIEEEDLVDIWDDLEMHFSPVQSRKPFDVLWQGLYEPRLDQIKTVIRAYKTALLHAL